MRFISSRVVRAGILRWEAWTLVRHNNAYVWIFIGEALTRRGANHMVRTFIATKTAKRTTAQ